MSIAFPIVDVSAVPVGGSGIISLRNAGVTSTLNQIQKPAHVQIYNESGSGLQIGFSQSGNSHVIPAGGWITLPLPPGEDQLTYTVVYALQNPQVTKLLVVYYGPGEPVPSVATLGNSPTAVGGQVSTTQTTSLVNTGNAPATNIINVQPSDATSQTLVSDNSGNLTIKGDIAGALTLLLQLIASAASGNSSVILGDANRLVEIVGNLLLDTGIILKGGSKILDASGGQTVLSSTGATNTVGLNAVNGLSLTNGTRIGSADNAAGNLLDWTSTDVYLKAKNGKLYFQNPSGTNRWSIQQWNFGNVSAAPGQNTVNHGLPVTPDKVFAICTSANSSATVGVSAFNSTSFVLTNGSGQTLLFDWWVIKF